MWMGYDGCRGLFYSFPYGSWLTPDPLPRRRGGGEEGGEERGGEEESMKCT